ncbi:MAG: YraN family protein [bacterium]|nr:YraN family protein [bacterium]
MLLTFGFDKVDNFYFILKLVIESTLLVESDKKKIGITGENQAASYLEGLGFEILERNYRYKRAEIDIIAMKSNLLLFVEVKARKNNRFGNPEEFVSNSQKKLIIEAADDYIHAINWQKNIRYDIIAITGKELEHFQDAFY